MSLDVARISVTLLILFFCSVLMRYTLRQIRKLSTSLSEESKQINKEQLCKIIFSIGGNYLARCTRMSSTNKGVIYQTRKIVFHTASQTAKKRAETDQDVQCSKAFFTNFVMLSFPFIAHPYCARFSCHERAHMSART